MVPSEEIRDEVINETGEAFGEIGLIERPNRKEMVPIEGGPIMAGLNDADL